LQRGRIGAGFAQFADLRAGFVGLGLKLFWVMAARRRTSSSRKRSRFGGLLRAANRAAMRSKLFRKYARSCMYYA